MLTNDQPSTSLGRRHLRTIVGGVTLVVAVAGCGSSGEAPDVAESGGPTTNCAEVAGAPAAAGLPRTADAAEAWQTTHDTNPPTGLPRTADAAEAWQTSHDHAGS